jgi:hypothetical protein
MAKQFRLRCNQCEALMINGVFCHETGCPNSKARYDNESGEWIKQRKRFECGCAVDADNLCCNYEDMGFGDDLTEELAVHIQEEI